MLDLFAAFVYVAIDDAVGFPSHFISCHIGQSFPKGGSDIYAALVEPLVEGFLMDTQATLSKPHYLKIFGRFANAVGSTNTYPKDFRNLLGSIGLSNRLAMIS